MELCNKISQHSVVKIISKKQLFLEVKLKLKLDKSFKNCKKNFPDLLVAIFFTTCFDGKQRILFS